MTATPAGMTYADYLDLKDLFGAQRPRSDLHDEMLFIIIHQTKELWMKQMLHELELAIRLVEEDGVGEAYKALARVSRIQSVMTLSWDVLATLTPVDYLAFRHVLGTSSGFQSAQFREIEYRLGLKDAAFLQHYAEGTEERRRLDAALSAESLRDSSIAIFWCSSSVGKVFCANCFSSVLRPERSSCWKSFTALLWSSTMSCAYWSSKALPCSV